MSVHIGELHADVTQWAPVPSGSGAEPDPARQADAQREAALREAWLDHRVAAEGFDD
jgi:hypothetical protein